MSLFLTAILLLLTHIPLHLFSSTLTFSVVFVVVLLRFCLPLLQVCILFLFQYLFSILFKCLLHYNNSLLLSSFFFLIFTISDWDLLHYFIIFCIDVFSFKVKMSMVLMYMGHSQKSKTKEPFSKMQINLTKQDIYKIGPWRSCHK